MRLPAVAIAAAFACGIAFGLQPAVARNASSHILLSSFFILVGVLVLTVIILVGIGRIFVAGIASILGCVLLGSRGLFIAEQPRDGDHVISLLERARLPLIPPLRRHCRVRDEP